MTLNIVIFEKFKASFEQKCFRLIVEAYQTSLREKIIQLDWYENDISSELHKYINENPLRIKWKISTNVEAFIPKNILKERGFSNKYPRIDFRLTSFLSTYEYEYFFEAKRLKANDSNLNREYVNEGIDRFILKKYPYGGMLGYILEGSSHDTIAGINSVLMKYKRNSEALNPKPNKFHNEYYESIHLTIGIIKHLLFNFTNTANH